MRAEPPPKLSRIPGVQLADSGDEDGKAAGPKPSNRRFRQFRQCQYAVGVKIHNPSSDHPGEGFRQFRQCQYRTSVKISNPLLDRQEEGFRQ